MHLEKEDKSMETYKAEVVEDEDEEYFLALELPKREPLYIPLTQDLPKDVQEVFNQLIVSLKDGPFEFSIEDDETSDLYYQVSQEYISQLNAELEEVFDEMEEHGLMTVDGDTGKLS